MPKIAIMNHGERSIRDIRIIKCEKACPDKGQTLHYRVKGQKPFLMMSFSRYVKVRSRFLELQQANVR